MSTGLFNCASWFIDWVTFSINSCALPAAKEDPIDLRPAVNINLSETYSVPSVIAASTVATFTALFWAYLLA